jgi:cell division septal protein FtsQ
MRCAGREWEGWGRMGRIRLLTTLYTIFFVLIILIVVGSFFGVFDNPFIDPGL